MATRNVVPAAAWARTKVSAIAGTSERAFRRSLAEVAGAGHVGSVLLVGVAKIGVLEKHFAPQTGLVKLEDVERRAAEAADRLASKAVTWLAPDVAARHCSCRGWNDERLPRLLRDHGCASLCVHASDIGRWRLRRLRKSLMEVGVSLIVMDAESNGGAKR